MTSERRNSQGAPDPEMSGGASTEPATELFLNPFALPPETSGLFRMLVVAAVLLTWSLGAHMIEVPNLWVASFQVGSELWQIQEERKAALLSDPTAPFPSITPQEIAAILNDTELPRLAVAVMLELLRVVISLLLLLMLGGLSWFFYWLFPIFRERYQAIRPLDEHEAPLVVTEVRQLAFEIGLPTPPELAVMPGFLGGLALRRKRRDTLVLAGTPPFLERVWDDSHRVVALHEMGHLINGDTRNGELTRALGLAVGVILLIATSFMAGYTRLSTAPMALFAWRTVGVLALSWFLWAGLVRTREFYADWRVMVGGFGQALARLLQLPDRHASSLKHPILKRLPWRLHPSRKERLDVLRNSRPLFTTSPKLAVLTGTLLGVLAGNVDSFFMDSMLVTNLLATFFLLKTPNPPIIVGVLSTLGTLAVAFAILILASRWIVEALGVQLLRSALFDLDRAPPHRWGYGSLAGTALLFVLGLEAGLLLTRAAGMGWERPGYLALWVLGFTVLVWLWLVQTRALGRLVLGACPSASSRDRALGWALLFSTLQLTAFLWPALGGRLTVLLAASPDLVDVLERHDQPYESLPFFGMTVFVLLAIALFLSMVLGLVMLITTTLWLTRRKEACPCGESCSAWRRVGQNCRKCRRPLAPWLYYPISRITYTEAPEAAQ